MANLVTTITESITLNGKERGSTNTLTIGSVTEIFHRIVTCPSGSDTTVATFQAATNTSDGALNLDNVKYIRLTNLDESNPINLSLQVAGGEDGTANMSTTILVAAGRSFIMGSPHDGIALDDDDHPIVTSLVDLESLLVDPSSNNVTIEVFIAC